MTDLGNPAPQPQTVATPPQGQSRQPVERFEAASRWVEVGLTAALVGVGIAQFCVYNRQAGILDLQTRDRRRRRLRLPKVFKLDHGDGSCLRLFGGSRRVRPLKPDSESGGPVWRRVVPPIAVRRSK